MKFMRTVGFITMTTIVMFVFGVGCMVKAIVTNSAEISKLQSDNETLWQRIEMLEEDRDYHAEDIISLEEDVEGLEGRWVDVDTFEVSNGEGQCKGIGFRIGDSIYLPTRPCKDESPFAIHNDKEFNAMAAALLAAYEGGD
jgi:hypothetical protein